MFRALAINSVRRGVIVRSSSLVAARDFHSASKLLAAAKEKEEPVTPSLVEKYKLDDPTRYVPLTITGFSFGWLTGLYHFDAETQILALWVLFCATVYSRGGPLIADMLDETSKNILKEHTAAEDAEIEAVKLTLAAYKSNSNVMGDIKDLFDAQNTLAESMAAAAQNRLRHGIREAYVRKLDTILRAEEKTSAAIKERLVSAATKSVTELYQQKSQTALRANAIDAAIAALGNPKSAKRPQNVQNAYREFLADFNSQLKAAAGKSFDLPAEAVKDIKENVEGVARRENIDVSLVNVPNKTTIIL